MFPAVGTPISVSTLCFSSPHCAAVKGERLPAGGFRSTESGLVGSEIGGHFSGTQSFVLENSARFSSRAGSEGYEGRPEVSRPPLHAVNVPPAHLLPGDGFCVPG